MNHTNACKLINGLPLAFDNIVHLLVVWCSDGDVNILETTPLSKISGCEVGSGVGAEVLYFRGATVGPCASEVVLNGVHNVSCVGFGKTDQH